VYLILITVVIVWKINALFPICSFWLVHHVRLHIKQPHLRLLSKVIPQVNIFPHSAFNFIDPNSIILVLIFLNLRFPSVWSLDSLSTNKNLNVHVFVSFVYLSFALHCRQK
jgi:hypothetical protein